MVSIVSIPHVSLSTPGDGHFSCSQLLAVVNYVAMDMGIHSYLGVSVSVFFW